MPLVDSERTAIAGFEAARLKFVSLHLSDPGPASGAGTEASGGTPAYARVALSFPAAANGVSTSAEATINVPAGTYTHFGVWDAITAGNFLGGNPLSTTANMTVGGQIKVTISVPVSAT